MHHDEFIRAHQTEVVLADGGRVTVRPIVPGDRAELRRRFQDLSDETIRRRFFVSMAHLSERQLTYLTEIDYVDHFAWGAMEDTPVGSVGLGVARYIRLPDAPDVAEAAVLVVDEAQGRGIGSVLLELISQSAMANGIDWFRTYVQRDNVRVLDAVTRAGTVRGGDDDLVEVDIQLPAPTELPTSEMYDVLRAAAAGGVDSDGRE